MLIEKVRFRDFLTIKDFLWGIIFSKLIKNQYLDMEKISI